MNIQEITYNNESLTVGLIMLTIGNLLWGQWANEKLDVTGDGIQRNLGIN
jgi:hypothetical protein